VADMGKPGVSLLLGERVSARLVGNHIRDGRAYEGYLYVTSQRLVHVPWSAAQARGAVQFDIPLTDVAQADAAPRGTNWRDGSWRRRLRITRLSGGTELFVVWRVRHAIGIVDRARQEAEAG
jgi:hypothetical protein